MAADGALAHAAGDAFDARLREAWTVAADGDAPAAVERFAALAADFPDSDVALHDLGICLSAARRFDEAATAFRRCLALNDRRDDTHYNLGVACEQSGRPAQAIDAYVAALGINDSFLEPAMRIGALCEARGERERAFQAYARIGMRLSGRGDLEGAVTALSAAVRVDPGSAPALYALGNSLLRAGRADEAAAFLERAIAARRDFAEAHNALGLVHYRRGDIDTAEQCFKAALAHKAIFPEARNNLGNCLATRGRHAAAVRQYRFAVNQYPGYADAHVNAAQELHILGRDAEAEQACREALAIRSDDALAHTTLAWLLLARGDFSAGWRAFEWRTSAANAGRYLPDPRGGEGFLPRPSTLLPIDFRGRRVLLIGSGGLGTEIFFLRFVGALRARGCAFIGYRTETRLAPLVQSSGVVDTVFTEDAAIDPGFDLALSASDLPLALGHGDGDPLPGPLSLSPTARARSAIAERLTALTRAPVLALTWRAGLAGDGPRRKQVPVHELARAIAPWKGALVSVQRAAQAHELSELERLLGCRIHDFGDVNDDLDLALALFERCAEYVGVSNTNMYLSAAVGRSARVLVKRPLEWRWCGADAGSSRWFPGFRLYPEDPARGWAPALATLRRDLHDASD